MTETPPNLDILRGLNEAGYGFYQNTTRVRADDLLVRSRAADALHRAAAIVYLAEQRARRALPAPTREHPQPDPAALAAIRALKALQERIETLETTLRGAAALPDGDFSTLIPSETVRQRLVGLDAALLEDAAAAEAAAATPGLPARLDALGDAIAARVKLAAAR